MFINLILRRYVKIGSTAGVRAFAVKTVQGKLQSIANCVLLAKITARTFFLKSVLRASVSLTSAKAVKK